MSVVQAAVEMKQAAVEMKQAAAEMKQAAVDMEPAMQIVDAQQVPVERAEPHGHQQNEVLPDGYDLWQEVEGLWPPSECEMELIEQHMEVFTERYNVDEFSVMEYFKEFCVEEDRPGNLHNFKVFCYQYARYLIFDQQPDSQSEDSGACSGESDDE